MIILTKKQKIAMRARRGKKKQSAKEQQVSSTSSSNQQQLQQQPEATAITGNEHELKENPQDDQNIHAGKRKLEEATSSSDPNDDMKQAVGVRIRLPMTSSSFSSSDLKKFRKDWRRKIHRKHPAIRRDNIIFHTDSTTAEEEAVRLIYNEKVGGDNSPPKNKKKITPPLSFPRINDILAQQKVAMDIEKERQKRLDEYDKVLPEEKMKFVALDCEMVGIGIDGKKSALARVSIVDWDNNTLIDTFCTVPERVTDFRTWVSGVRAKDIQLFNSSNENNVMEVNACRTLVGNIIKDKIVVGHSLKNDFSALIMDHPKTHVRDTARYKPYMRRAGRNGGKYRPRKLRDLVQEKLGRKIQVQGESHNSVDDAIAAMDLYKLERIKWESEVVKKMRKKT